MKLINLALIIIIIILLFEICNCYREGLTEVKPSNSTYSSNLFEPGTSNDALTIQRSNNLRGTLMGVTPYLDKPKIIPLSFMSYKIVDPSAGKAGTGGDSSKESHRYIKPREAKSKNNFTKVTENNALYEVISYSTNTDTSYTDAAYVCTNNNYITDPKDQKGGWSKKSLENNPCVGFYSTDGNDKQFNILVACKDDCDTLETEPISKSLKKMIPKGETFWPGKPDKSVGNVWRQKKVDSTGKPLNHSSITADDKFKEMGSKGKHLEIGRKSKNGVTKVQAFNECKQEKSNIGLNPCLGIMKEKGKDFYYFLYKAIGEYKPDTKVDDIYRKFGNDNYSIVSKDKSIKNVRSILNRGGASGAVATIGATDVVDTGAAAATDATTDDTGTTGDATDSTTVTEGYRNIFDTGKVKSAENIGDEKKTCNSLTGCVGIYSEKGKSSFNFLKKAGYTFNKSGPLKDVEGVWIDTVRNKKMDKKWLDNLNKEKERVDGLVKYQTELDGVMKFYNKDPDKFDHVKILGTVNNKDDTGFLTSLKQCNENKYPKGANVEDSVDCLGIYKDKNSFNYNFLGYEKKSNVEKSKYNNIFKHTNKYKSSMDKKEAGEKAKWLSDKKWSGCQTYCSQVYGLNALTSKGETTDLDSGELGNKIECQCQNPITNEPLAWEESIPNIERPIKSNRYGCIGQIGKDTLYMGEKDKMCCNGLPFDKDGEKYCGPIIANEKTYKCDKYFYLDTGKGDEQVPTENEFQNPLNCETGCNKLGGSAYTVGNKCICKKCLVHEPSWSKTFNWSGYETQSAGQYHSKTGGRIGGGVRIIQEWPLDKPRRIKSVEYDWLGSDQGWGGTGINYAFIRLLDKDGKKLADIRTVPFNHSMKHHSMKIERGEYKWPTYGPGGGLVSKVQAGIFSIWYGGWSTKVKSVNFTLKEDVSTLKGKPGTFPGGLTYKNFQSGGDKTIYNCDDWSKTWPAGTDAKAACSRGVVHAGYKKGGETLCKVASWDDLTKKACETAYDCINGKGCEF